MKLITGFGLVALLWLAIWGGFVAFNEYLMRSGTEVLFYIEQRDPHDFFRGDYVQLQFDISTIKVAEEKVPSIKNVAYVSLEKAEDGCYKSIGLSNDRPDGLFIRGKVGGWASEEERTGNRLVTMHYGIERFYIREGMGVEIEKAMREALKEGKRLKAKVMIDRWGRPLIKSLVLKDREISI